MVCSDLTILVVDDTKANVDILVDLLVDYDVVVALDGFTALEIVNEDKIDLILLDIMMPGIDGYEVCKKLKSNPKTMNIPIIFITAKSDENAIEKAYDVGGIDYVSKPVKPKELLARVKTQLKMQSLMQNLDFLASYDSMTGIYNRRKFFELTKVIFEYEDNMFVSMIDIDMFKAINDKYGHPFGDEVIKKVATTISEYIQNEFIFARLGGEEFAIVFVNKDEKEIKELTEEIRRAIENIQLFTDDNKLVTFTISSGVSKKEKSTISLDHLLKEADDALYQAKDAGRNKSIFRV